jgi:hypothetical protein
MLLQATARLCVSSVLEALDAPCLSGDVKRAWDDMEHQDSVTWPFFGIISAYSLFVIGCSIYFHDAHVLLWGFGMLLAAAVAWGLIALLNVVMFPPLFRLLGRLTGKQNTTESDESHDEAA